MGGVFDESWLTSHQTKMARLRQTGEAVRDPRSGVERDMPTAPAPRSVRKRAKPSARLATEGKIRLLMPQRPVLDEVVVSFSMPPSANHAWRNIENGKGRVRSDDYLAWIETCCIVLADARIGRIEGPYAVLIEARRPRGAKGALRDIDNLIKPTLDVLKNTGMTIDARHCQEVTARWAAERGDGGIVVVIRKWGGA
jgi:Holliday junction resolvase RusA-like endonuclease